MASGELLTNSGAIMLSRISGQDFWGMVPIPNTINPNFFFLDESYKSAIDTNSYPEAMALTLKDLEVLNWIEEWYLRKHSFPPVDSLSSFFPNYDLKKSLTDELFLTALSNRGIKLPENKTKLDNEQLAAIAVMANFRDSRSPTAKLRAIGVSWTKWQGWMRDKYFKEFLQDLCAVNFEDSFDVAQAGILKGVEKGNVDSVKLYLELTGRYTPQSQEVVNLKLILSRLLETIQIHVKDPNVLRNIAGDFEKVLSGGVPTAPKELNI